MTKSYDLQRFIEAQDTPFGSSTIYQTAVKELMDGHKVSHWMWFVFPQIKGLGKSPTAQRFALDGLTEAKAYLDCPLLGGRLRECVELALAHSGKNPEHMFGYINAIKFHSCLTLFKRAASERGDVILFREGLRTFYGGKEDRKTLRRIKL